MIKESVLTMSKEKTILIADAGSTKVEWACIPSPAHSPISFNSEGVNVILLTEQQLSEYFQSINQKLLTLTDSPVSEVYYYGAGCATPEICQKTSEAIKKIWQEAEVEVSSDLTGAAKSLFKDKPGIACILGTGSNSGVFSGLMITDNIPPLGFILGDEGSGTALGKRLIKELFKSDMDAELKKNILSESGLSLTEIINRVYRQPFPNKFISSLVPIIRKHLDSPFIHNMVVEEFREFFRRNVKLYSNAARLPISFIGSVAFHFESLLREAAEKENISVNDVKKAPMEGLVEFHLR